MGARNYNRGMADQELEPVQDYTENSDETHATMVYEPGEEDSGATESSPAAAMADAPGYTLVVQRGMWAGMTWRLSPGVTKIGRHRSNDIGLYDITVSRHHCRMRLDSTGLSIEDLGSTNGSYVNDSLVEEASLSPGDRLMIGKFRLLVAMGR